MSRYGLRVGPAYPWPRYVGDVITFGNSSREQVEEIRDQMATGEFHEVVELDGNGLVIEPTVSCCGLPEWCSNDPCAERATS